MPTTVKPILLVALALGSVFLQGISVFYMIGDAGHGLAVSQSVHVYEGTSQPRAYFAWDWFSRPMRGVGTTTVNNNCREDEKYDCGLEPWQLTDSCPEKGQTLSESNFATTQSLHDVRNQYYLPVGTTHDHEPFAANENENTVISYPSHSFNQVDAVCKHARVSNQIHMIQNNNLSWGMFGSHSVIVLQYFIFSIFLLLAVSELMQYYRDSQIMGSYGYMISVFTWTVGIIFSIVFIRLLQDSTVSLSDGNYHYATPNASFAYGILHLVLWAYFCSRKVEDEKTKEELKSTGSYGGDMYSSRASMGYAAKPDIDMSTFKIGALREVPQMPSSAPVSINFNSMDTVVELKTWPVLQLVVLPLWFLIITTSGHTYNTDTKIQGMFAAALVFAIIDVYADALDAVFAAFLSAQSKTNSTKMWSDEIALYFTNFFVITIQIFIAVFVNFQMGLSYENIGASDHSTLVSQIDMSGLQFFNVYAGLLVLLKVVKCSYPKLRMWTTGTKMSFFNGIDDVITFLFVAIVFAALMVNTAHLYHTDNKIVNAMEQDHSTWNDLRSIWGSKMIKIT